MKSLLKGPPSMLGLLDDGKKFELFDADFRGGPPVYDKGVSKTAMICDRGNVQPDGKGGSVAKNTPVCDRQYGLRTNGEYVQLAPKTEDFNDASWEKNYAVTITSDAVAGPFSGSFADKYSISMAIDRNLRFFSYLAYTGTHTFTQSLWIKAIVDTSVLFRIVFSASSDVEETFSLSAGVWQKLVLTGSGDGSVRMDLFDKSGNTGDLFYLWGAQLTETAYAMPYAPNDSSTSSVTVGTNYSYDDAGTQKGPHWKLKEDGQVIPAMQWFWDILDGKADGVEKVTINADFSQWADDDPVGWTVLNEDIDNYITEHAEGARIVSNNTSAVGIRQEYNVASGSKQQLTIQKSNHVSGEIRFQVRDETNSTTLITENIGGSDKNGSFSVRFDVPETCTTIQINQYRDINADTDFVIKSWSLKKITPAQGVITDTWRPGFASDDVPISAIMGILAVEGGTGSGLFYALKNSSGIVRLVVSDSGGNVTFFDTPFDADTDYPWKIVFGTHPTEGANKMQLQVKVDGSWEASAVMDFTGTWNPGDYLSFGYDNIYPQFPARALKATGNVIDADWKEPT